MTQLPPGQGTDHTRLWDNQWRLVWDSATSKDSAYRYISTWVNATIDRPDGSRWSGQFYRTPLGIQRYTFPDPDHLKRLLAWPEFPGAGGEDLLDVAF